MGFIRRNKKVVLYCVLTRFEIHELKEIIKTIDSSAFIAISDVSEIIGTHVKKTGKISGSITSDVSKEPEQELLDNITQDVTQSDTKEGTKADE